MDKILEKIRSCKECERHLKDGVNPIITASAKSKIVVIGQAPGRKVHETSTPWNDKSGDTLRIWMGIDKDMFYNADKIALMPMGFCYPGKAKSGDLPPRRECAPLWHSQLLENMNEVKLILLVGQYAQKYYLLKDVKSTLTETVRNYHDYLPKYFPLPHPSPRNNIWQKRNKWFSEEVLPELKNQINHFI